MACPSKVTIDKPQPQPIIYETPLSYLSAERQDINDRVARLALSDQFNNQFTEGQALYQQFALGEKDVIRTVTEHNSPLNQIIYKPSPSELSSGLEVQEELMKQQESEAAKIVATQLGFVYQALAEKDLPAAIWGVHRQREILDSPPVIESIVGHLVPLLQEEIADLPKYQEFLQMIEIWDTETPVPSLVHYAYLEKGVTLSRNSHDRENHNSYQLVDQIATSHIRSAEDGGYLGEAKIRQHLSQTLYDLQEKIIGDELTAADPLADDQLLGGKLLKSILDTPEIFSHLHPRVQEELRVTLEGFIQDSTIGLSMLTISPPVIQKPEKNIAPITIPVPIIENTAALSVSESLNENDIYTLNNLQNIAQLNLVAGGQHEDIKTESTIELAKFSQHKFFEIWKTIKKDKIGGINLIVTKLFQKDHIPISEFNRIDELRRELEQSQPYVDKDPQTVAKVIALNLIKKHINIFNGLSE